jgi:4-hydroxy-tetrahydrodipicolinate reductase
MAAERNHDKITVVVAGAAGRMGRRLVALVAEDAAFELAGAVEHAGHRRLGADSGELAGAGPNGVAVRERIESDFEVLIDFSLPAGTVQWLDLCLKRERAFVTGVTGFDDRQRRALQEASRQIPVLAAPNMSLGINLMLRLVREAAGVLGDYDAEIVEAHHRFKRDAPSGTAAALLDAIGEGRPGPAAGATYGRRGADLARPTGQVGVHSLRGGDEIGWHEVVFAGLGETLSIRHRARSRDAFARGALRAAAWIKDRPAGFYSMQDVLLPAGAG